MRNLQKILALVLALVMSLSLMATAGARDFTDGDQIDETFAESVDVLTGLEVFQGYPTGDFQPKGDITRAEVAAIIYRIATGDVTDSQVGIYADYNKFSDVPSDNWAAGYINYCANAEYIKGRGDGKFYPQDKVTGYEALAMILRVVGYDKNGEFTGADWQVQTAATANQRKVTEKVTATTLGNPASRETVAELLCKAILIEKVNYTLAFGYQISTDPKDTIAYETFKMEKLTGVVTGNEIADLKETSPMAAGQTRMVIDGSERVLNVVSGLDDIGESCRVYVRPQSGTTRYDMVTANVYATEENNVYDSGDRVSDVAGKSYADNGINSIAGAQHFINFDQGEDYEARIRIRYEIVMGWSEYEAMMVLATNDSDNSTQLLWAPGADTTNPDAAIKSASLDSASNWKTRREVNANWTYTKTIESFAKLTDQDYDFIRTIFAKGDRTNVMVKGEVYVGTNTQIANPEDISDDIRWEDFVNTYLKTEENRKQVESNGLGNRLKVIDNNNDGVADYVLQTIFTVAKVAPNGTSLDVNGMKFADSSTMRNDAVNNVEGEDLVSVTGINLEASEDTLAAGDVVVYALIDGNIRAQKAESETSRVTSINRSTTPPTATIESGEKKESNVHEHSDGLANGVTNMVIGTNYTSYFDLYGNLAAFTEGEVGKFVLITDGWYNQTVSGREYAIQAYVDGALQTVNITNNGQLFINPAATNNSWGNLRSDFGTNGDINNQNNGRTDNRALHTIVATLDDGNLIPVDKSTFYRQQVAMLDMKNNNVPKRDNTARAVAYDTNFGTTTPAYNHPIDGQGDVEVLGRSDTVYYTVYRDTRSTNTTTGLPNYVVRSYTGYGNVPSIDKTYIEDVYAVGIAANRTTANDKAVYYTAEVVVIELNDKYATSRNDSEQVFIPGATVVNNSASRVAGYGIETITMIRENGEVQDVQVDTTHSNIKYYNTAEGVRIFSGLYYMDPTDTNSNIYTIEPMTAADIRANNYLAGFVTKSTAIVPTDFVRVDMQVRDVDAAGNYTNGPLDVIDDYKMDSEPSKNVTANSKLYTLGYSASGVATLSEAAAGVVFDQNPDQNKTNLSTSSLNELYNSATGLWNNNPRNEVLVRYNGSSVVWAISFREFRGTAWDQTAQQVWFECLPAAYADSGVAFWGKVGGLRGGDIVVRHNEVKDSFLDLSAFAGTIKSHTVEERQIDNAGNFTNTWVAIDENSVTAPALREQQYRLTINLNNGTTYVYYLTKQAATTGADLKLKANALAGAVLTNTFPELGTLPGAMELDRYIAQYEISTGATATWTFVTNGGVQITFEGKNNTNGDAVPSYECTSGNYTTQTTTEVQYATVTVVAERNGASNTYRSAGVPTTTVTVPAGVTVDGVAGNQTVFRGQVLTVKAPGAGTLTINGETFQVNSDNNFTVRYTVKSDAANVAISYSQSTDVGAADGKLTIGTVPVGVTVKNAAGALLSGGSKVDGPSVDLILTAAASANAGKYLVTVTNGVTSKTYTPDVTTAGTTLNVAIPSGNWTMNVEKENTTGTTVTMSIPEYGMGLTVTSNGVEYGNAAVVMDSAVNGNTFVFTVTNIPDNCEVTSVTATNGTVVNNSGTYTFTKDNSGTASVIAVAIAPKSGYQYVTLYSMGDNAVVSQDGKSYRATPSGNKVALKSAADVKVSAVDGYAVLTLRRDAYDGNMVGNGYEFLLNKNLEAQYRLTSADTTLYATVKECEYVLTTRGSSHGVLAYVAYGAKDGATENLRYLTAAELTSFGLNNKDNVVLVNDSLTTNQTKISEVLDYNTIDGSDPSANQTMIKCNAGFLKIHTDNCGGNTTPTNKPSASSPTMYSGNYGSNPKLTITIGGETLEVTPS